MICLHSCLGVCLGTLVALVLVLLRTICIVVVLVVLLNANDDIISLSGFTINFTELVAIIEENTLCIIVLLGATHGYLGSICVILTSQAVSPHEKNIAGVLSGIFVNIGIITGSWLALYFLMPILNS